MTIELFEKTFPMGSVFMHKNVNYKVDRVKILNFTKYIIITKKKTFSMLGSQLDDFLSEIVFVNTEDFERKEEINNQKTKEIMSKEIENSAAVVVSNQAIKLPKVSSTAISALEAMLSSIVSGDVTPENLSKAKAVCDISKEMIAIGRLELDYIKIQTNK